MAPTALVLYVPALHAGYDQLFRQAREAGADRLYLLGSELLKDFPLLEREIRQVDPETMAKAIRGLGYFSSVTVASAADLKKLAAEKASILLSEEQLSDRLATDYFGKNPIRRLPIFLRWDEKYVSQAVGEATYDAAVTAEHFHRDIIKKARLEAALSSDWFRQVGAILVLDNQVRVTTHNTRQPSPQEPWMVGDPRLYMEYGKADPHRKLTTHAEELLIASCARDGIATKGGWIYATTFPCPSCACLIGIAGLSRCYFSTGYADLNSDQLLASFGVEAIRVS